MSACIYARYIYVDSSPQFGFDFLCWKKGLIKIPKGQLDRDLGPGYDLSQNYERMSRTVIHWEAKEKPCGTPSGKKSDGACSDQQGMGDGSTRSLIVYMCSTPGNREGLFMYLALLNMPGMLHILYNALKEAVASADATRDFIEQLRVVEVFLRNETFHRAFQAYCLVSDVDTGSFPKLQHG